MRRNLFYLFYLVDNICITIEPLYQLCLVCIIFFIISHLLLIFLFVITMYGYNFRLRQNTKKQCEVWIKREGCSNGRVRQGINRGVSHALEVNVTALYNVLRILTAGASVIIIRVITVLILLSGTPVVIRCLQHLNRAHCSTQVNHTKSKLFM